MDPIKAAPTQEAKLHFLDYWRIIRIRKTVILAVFLLVVITATLVTFILPESFSSSATIKIERDQSDIASMTTGPSFMNGAYDPYFIQTEFEVMKSELILGKVIEDLHLNTEWGKRYAGGETLKTTETLAILKGKMDLRPVRNTSLIEIRVYSEKPDEASRIANAIAETYQAHRKEQRSTLNRGGIEELLKQHKEMNEKIAEAQQKVAELRKNLGISDSMANEAGPVMLMTAETLRRFEQERVLNQVDLNGEKTLLDHLLTLKSNLGPAELAQVIPTAQPDPILQDLLQQLSLADQHLLATSKDYGPENPEYIKAAGMVQKLNDGIIKRVDGILLGLETRVDSVRQRLASLENEVKKAQTEDIENASKSQPYFDAKRTLDDMLKFRTLLEAKISAEQIDQALPKTSMVEIVEHAVPGTKPVKPNKPLNIALGIIIGLVVGVGLAFFIEYLDTSVKTIDDVERALQAPVLGVIPQNVGLMIEEGIESPHAEAYRVLRTNILFSRKDDKLNSIAVVSAGAGEGKSTTVFNLAAIFAQSGQRVIVVDSDLRRPTIHKILNVTNNLGLTNYLLKQNTLEQVIQTSAIPTLDFMASGKLPSSSMGILSSTRMRDLIAELKQRYDFVFFDSPPIMGVSDASILASGVDMTLQVIQYRRYPQPMNIRAKQLIEKVGGNLVGIVLNNINMSQDESYYYYSGYYHDYYYSHYSQSDDSRPKPEGGADKGKGEEGGDKPKLDIKKKY